MATHALLLRGINVGTGHQVPMAQLRELLTGLGHTEVQTYLRSGNVVLTPAPGTGPDLEHTTADAIGRRFGFDVPVVVRTAAHLSDVIAANPYPEAAAKPTTLHVTFFASEPDTSALDTTDLAAYAPDHLTVRGKEMYRYCPNGLSKSTFSETFFRRLRLGTSGTARNWRTVLAIDDLLRTAET
ncbi:MAG TPA: DUF1697 domain-containing protein [Jiangellaceae bacterium]|nr:DUF1697 domain-containing protein [Jiangellaceae bacterium]